MGSSAVSSGVLEDVGSSASSSGVLLAVQQGVG